MDVGGQGAPSRSASSCRSRVVHRKTPETKIPCWVIQLIQRFELFQRGFSKYCYGVDRALIQAEPGARVSALI